MNEIKEEDWKLVEARLEKMPDTLAIAVLGKLMARETLLEEVKERTETGELIARMQLEYLKYLVKGYK